MTNHEVVYSNTAWTVRNSEKALQTVMEHAVHGPHEGLKGLGFRWLRVLGKGSGFRQRLQAITKP